MEPRSLKNDNPHLGGGGGGGGWWWKNKGMSLFDDDGRSLTRYDLLYFV